MTTYAVVPFNGRELRVGATYEVENAFPESVHMVLVSVLGFDVAYVQGSGAIALRELGCPNIVIRSVSDVSGCGQGEVVT